MNTFSRRGFLGLAGVAGTTIGLSACGNGSATSGPRSTMGAAFTHRRPITKMNTFTA